MRTSLCVFFRYQFSCIVCAFRIRHFLTSKIKKKTQQHASALSFLFVSYKPVVHLQTQTATIYLWTTCDRRWWSCCDLFPPAGFLFLSASTWRWWRLRGESEWWKTHIFRSTLAAVSLETATGSHVKIKHWQDWNFYISFLFVCVCANSSRFDLMGLSPDTPEDEPGIKKAAENSEFHF